MAIAIGVLSLAAIGWVVSRRLAGPENKPQDPAEHGVITTVFWVGEAADASNSFIHNRSSVWVEDWVEAFGGVDDPNNRCGLQPCGFTPKENPFYFALPYNDLNDDCSPKTSQSRVPWLELPQPMGESAVKNRWIKIDYQGKTAYAQWQDAGPFGEDDANYVFGDAKPAASAGLDISPAAGDYLGMPGRAQTTWQFVESKDVPNGPWLKTITNTPPDCAR